jgi:hypothetical protein
MTIIKHNRQLVLPILLQGILTEVEVSVRLTSILTSSGQLLYFLIYKTTYLYEEINGTESFPSVRVDLLINIALFVKKKNRLSV